MKTLKNHKEKISIRVNICMPKMSTPIKVGIRTYVMYANCQTLFMLR